MFTNVEPINDHVSACLEEIKTDEVEAELKDGIVDVALPKEAPKHRKKVNLK